MGERDGEPTEPASTALRYAFHDLANLFTCILAAAAHRTADPAQRERDLAAIEEAARLGVELMHAVRRTTGYTAEPARLRDVVTTTTTLLAHLAARSGVRIDVELDDVVVALPGYALQEVVINLALNAIESMSRGGTVTIGGRAAAGRVRLSVVDEGDGIDAARLASLRGGGSTKGGDRGVGLASVYAIVERAGGTVELDSGAGGTCVVVELPTAD